MHNNGGSSLLSGDLRTSKPAMNKHAAGAHEPVSPNQRGDVEVAHQRENQRDAVDFALFGFGDTKTIAARQPSVRRTRSEASTEQTGGGGCGRRTRETNRQ